MSNVRITSPVGEALWPRLNSPDTKFDELGVYKVDLALPAKEAKAFIERVKELHTAVKGKHEFTWFKEELDDDGKKTGRVIIRFKAKNIKKRDGTIWDRKPIVVDTEGDRIMESVGTGSTMRVAAEVYVTAVNGKVFCTLQPLAVQVHDLKEFRKDDFGFKVKNNDEVETLSEGEDEGLF